MRKSIPTALPALTEKEDCVWAACCVIDARSPGDYILHEEILNFTGLNPRSFGGVIGSLQKKGYLSAFKDAHPDVELSCTARRLHQLELSKSCNHPNCECHQ